MYTFSTTSTSQSSSVDVRAVDGQVMTPQQSNLISSSSGIVKFEGTADSVPLALSTKRETKISDSLLEPLPDEVDIRISSSSIAGMSGRAEDDGLNSPKGRSEVASVDADRQVEADHKRDSRVHGVRPKVSASLYLVVRTQLKQQQKVWQKGYQHWTGLRQEADGKFIENTKRAIAVVNDFKYLPDSNDAAAQRREATENLCVANTEAQSAAALSENIRQKLVEIATALQAVSRTLASLETERLSIAAAGRGREGLNAVKFKSAEPLPPPG